MVPDRDAYAHPTSAVNTSIALLVLWTWFVWGNRIRNVLADEAVSGWSLVGTLALSASFLVLSSALAVLLVRRWRHGGGAASATALTRVLVALAGWTTAVWVVRALDIALTSDRGVPFVVVHVGLAVVSIGLSAWAVTADRKVRTIAHRSALTASQETMS
jgi:hypothetical protein